MNRTMFEEDNSPHTSLVTVGVPVYNGAKWLEDPSPACGIRRSVTSRC